MSERGLGRGPAATQQRKAPAGYVSGWCATGQCDRCAGIYARTTTCTCLHHTIREALDEPLELCAMAPYAGVAS